VSGPIPFVFAPLAGYRFDGLFYVAEYWSDVPFHGFVRWRYRLIRATHGGTTLVSPPPGAPPRVPTTVQRIVRSTAVAQTVISIHDHCCQISGEIIVTTGGQKYAEAAHIRPIGFPHNGPDETGNLLCLCPNYHARFDHGTTRFDPNGDVIDALCGAVLG
jgi:putative restriction endonuclease